MLGGIIFMCRKPKRKNSTDRKIRVFIYIHIICIFSDGSSDTEGPEESVEISNDNFVTR